jgi:hypothetical protein
MDVLCSGFVIAPLVLVHLYNSPEGKRAPRALTVAHAIIWAMATTVALGVALWV